MHRLLYFAKELNINANKTYAFLKAIMLYLSNNKSKLATVLFEQISNRNIFDREFLCKYRNDLNICDDECLSNYRFHVGSFVVSDRFNTVNVKVRDLSNSKAIVEF